MTRTHRINIGLAIFGTAICFFCVGVSTTWAAYHELNGPSIGAALLASAAGGGTFYWAAALLKEAADIEADRYYAHELAQARAQSQTLSQMRALPADADKIAMAVVDEIKAAKENFSKAILKLTDLRTAMGEISQHIETIESERDQKHEEAEKVREIMGVASAIHQIAARPSRPRQNGTVAAAEEEAAPPPEPDLSCGQRHPDAWGRKFATKPEGDDKKPIPLFLRKPLSGAIAPTLPINGD